MHDELTMLLFPPFPLFSLLPRLQLLNTTVTSIAVSVNDVLSQTYTALYGKGRDAGELVLSTAPLCATTEVQALYSSGIIDYETALPSAMHSLGCSASSISAALERRKTEESKKRKADELQEKVVEAESELRIKNAKNPPEAATSKAATPAPAPSGKSKAPPSEVGSAPDDDD